MTARKDETASLIQATLDATADGILVVDRAGKITRYNQKFVAMWRLPPAVIASGDDDQAIAFVLDQLTNPQAFVAQIQRVYATHEAESFDVLEFLDGRVFERYSRPQLLDGEYIGRIWSFRDVTDARRVERERDRLVDELSRSLAELRHTQAELVRTERLAAIGELAASIAHEVRNPLGAIFNSLAALKRLGPLPAEASMLTGVMEEEATRLNQMVADLLGFARPIEPKLEAHALVHIADEALASALRARPSECDGISARREVDPALPALLLDSHQMHQALVNVYLNALQAMGDAGTITTRLSIETDGAGARAALRIDDTGPGMQPAQLQRAFEPFFTTKAAGTGLGLAIVKRIVEAHAGRVWLDSTPGRGTAVEIRLPLPGQAA